MTLIGSRQGCLHNNQHSLMLVLNKSITAECIESSCADEYVLKRRQVCATNLTFSVVFQLGLIILVWICLLYSKRNKKLTKLVVLPENVTGFPGGTKDAFFV